MDVGEDPAAWDTYYHAPCPGHGSYPCADSGDRPYGFYANTTATDAETPDGMIAATTIAHLENATRLGRPWFVAMGLHKPHLPLVAPKRYEGVAVALPRAWETLSPAHLTPP